MSEAARFPRERRRSAAGHVLWYRSYHAGPASPRWGIIAGIILGLFAGTIARAVIPGRTEPGGCIGTTAVGILGALLGGFLASAIGMWATSTTSSISGPG